MKDLVHPTLDPATFRIKGLKQLDCGCKISVHVEGDPLSPRALPMFETICSLVRDLHTCASVPSSQALMHKRTVVESSAAAVDPETGYWWSGQIRTTWSAKNVNSVNVGDQL